MIDYTQAMKARADYEQRIEEVGRLLEQETYGDHTYAFRLYKVGASHFHSQSVREAGKGDEGVRQEAGGVPDGAPHLRGVWAGEGNPDSPHQTQGKVLPR